MKYYWKALRNSKVLVYDIINVLVKLISITINTYVLIWVNEIFINYDDPLIPMAKLLIGCLLNTVISAFNAWLGFTATHKLYRELIKGFIDKITHADYGMFVKYSTGHVFSVGHNGIKSITRLPREILDILEYIIRFIITAVMIVIIDSRAILPIIIIYGIAFVVLFKFNTKWRNLDKQVDKLRRQKTTMIEETVSGFAEFRSFDGANERQFRDIKNNDETTGNILGVRNKYTRDITAATLNADTIFMMIIIVLSLNGIRSGILVGTTAVILVTYAWRLVEPLRAIIEYIAMLSEDLAPLPVYQELMEYENTVSQGDLVFKGLETEIEFDNVSFSYGDSENVLDGTSFTIKKGQHIGICGPSGGGKSTLLRLIPKFYDPTFGAIRFDGVDIRNYTQDSVRKNMGIVHQDPFMFDVSIGDNIRFARKDRNVTEFEMREACKRANIYDFIMSLPDKFDTNVGPKGLKLSGGQKQRIALARLFIADPEIVILDEATSALDTETERAIQRAIDELDCTVIVVAHRLSTIRKSDKIIVIDNHHVAEEGSHDELMEKKGLYAHMIELAQKED